LFDFRHFSLAPFNFSNYITFMAEMIMYLADHLGVPPWVVGVIILLAVVGIIALIWRKMQYMQ
jgi:hypothetical protein